MKIIIKLIIAALLFGCLLNPVFKIYFTRNVWNDIDVIIAILLLVWVIIDVIIEGKRAYDLHISGKGGMYVACFLTGARL